MNFKKEFSNTDTAPFYATEHSAGCDLTVAECALIKPKTAEKVNLGLAFEIPEGFFGLVVPRSSLFQKTGLVLVNSVGIIDSDYRGYISANLFNTTDKEVLLCNGERIMQIIFIPYIKPPLYEVEQLSPTIRGSGGYGSTDEIPTTNKIKKVKVATDLPNDLVELIISVYEAINWLKTRVKQHDKDFNTFETLLDSALTEYGKKLGFVYDGK